MTFEGRNNNWEGDRERFLSLKEVEYVTSLKKSTIYALIQGGSFPAQRAITVRRRGWIASEVGAWVNQRAQTGQIGEAA